MQKQYILRIDKQIKINSATIYALWAIGTRQLVNPESWLDWCHLPLHKAWDNAKASVTLQNQPGKIQLKPDKVN